VNKCRFFGSERIVKNAILKGSRYINVETVEEIQPMQRKGNIKDSKELSKWWIFYISVSGVIYVIKRLLATSID
jgi:hypothetical protein